MYFAAYFGQIIVDNAVPVYVTEIVPYEYVGSYTAVRMLFLQPEPQSGSYISGVLAVDRPFVLIAVCAVSQMLHVMSYFFLRQEKVIVLLTCARTHGIIISTKRYNIYMELIYEYQTFGSNQKQL